MGAVLVEWHEKWATDQRYWLLRFPCQPKASLQHNGDLTGAYHAIPVPQLSAHLAHVQARRSEIASRPAACAECAPRMDATGPPGGLQRIGILLRAYIDGMGRDEHGTGDSERAFALLRSTGLKAAEAHALLRLIEDMASANLIHRFESKLDAQRTALNTKLEAVNTKSNLLLWFIGVGVALLVAVDLIGA